MITFITGVPGSGKSYKAVTSIYNNFSTSKNAKPDLKKDYENCYTNINELKFETLHDTKPLDLDVLKEKLTILHKLYKDKANDDILIEKCKELNIYRSLFVIDEAHNIFDTNDKILVWWLSYHRHLYHDIFLITQNLSLVFSKYKAFSEFFYKAKPTTVSLNRNTFKYDVFINSRMSMNAKSHTEKITKNDEVFDLYHSGDSVKASNILLKFYIFSALAIVLGIALIFYLFGGSSDTVEKKPIKTKVSHKPINKPQNKAENFLDNDYSELTLLKLSCSSTVCSNESISIPPQLLRIYIDSELIRLIYTQKFNKNLSEFYMECSNDFYNYLLPKEKYENFNNSDDNELSMPLIGK